MFISSSQKTKGIKIKIVNKDAKKKHYYFVFFHTSEKKTKAQI